MHKHMLPSLWTVLTVQGRRGRIEHNGGTHIYKLSAASNHTDSHHFQLEEGGGDVNIHTVN